jgi:hypothetical protein
MKLALVQTAFNKIKSKKGNNMKKVIVTILMVLCLASLANAATISLNTANTSKLKLKMETNTDVSAFHFSVTGLPIKSITCSDANKVVDWYGDKVIIYGLNKLPVMNGEVLTIEFTLPQNYGVYNIVITPLSASNGNAVTQTVTKGANGVIAITFQQTDVATTAAAVVGKAVTGIDVNQDGKLDSVDVQILANNLG